LFVDTLVRVSAAPTCSNHSGGGRVMVPTRIRFRNIGRDAATPDAAHGIDDA